jgi:hypothetical protein
MPEEYLVDAAMSIANHPAILAVTAWQRRTDRDVLCNGILFRSAAMLSYISKQSVIESNLYQGASAFVLKADNFSLAHIRTMHSEC